MVIKESQFIKKFKAKLISTFQIVNMGLISFYLGLKVEQNRKQKMIKLDQLAYIEKIFRKFLVDLANLFHTLIRILI